jgi:MFS family permease
MRGVLRERGFAALWFAQLVSRIGDSIHEIALIWIVYEVTGDPRLIAVVALASFTPSLLLSIPAGVVVDRVNRKYLLVGVEALRGVTVLAIPLVGEGPYLVPIVVAVALVTSSLEAFFGPAQQAMIPRLVETGNLDAANSLNNLTLSTSRLFYVVGGLVVGLGGSFLAFYINSATFLVSAVALLAVPTAAGTPETPPRAEGTSEPSLLGEALEGIRFIRGSPALLAVIAMGVFVDFAFVPLVVVLPVFATAVLGGGGAIYGFLLGAFFAGTLVGNLLVTPVREFVDDHRGPVMVAATMVTGLSVGAAAWLPTVSPTPLLTALAGFGLAGAANPFLNVPLTTYTQSVVPDEKRGKVFSVMRLGITGAAPIGIALAGPLVEAFGPVAVLLGMSTIVTLAGASGLFTPLVHIGTIAGPAQESGE